MCAIADSVEIGSPQISVETTIGMVVGPSSETVHVSSAVTLRSQTS